MRETGTLSVADGAGRAVRTAAMDDWGFCQHSLQQVSRTFSRPISMLRDPLERAVTCGYLLCRVADTIEDDANLSTPTRDELYALFLSVLEDRTAPEDFVKLFEASDVEPGAERELACNLPRVMRVFDAMEPEPRAICARWVAEMARGMAIYSHRPRGRDGVVALFTLADLERYCYFVAGTVGHLLTDLFVYEIADLPKDNLRSMQANAEEFGMGLQLVNILKDITDDAERGWSFIPRTVCAAEELSVNDLMDPGQRPSAHAALGPVFDRAHRGLVSALDYSLSIPPAHKDIRLFCLLPLWMAASTLAFARGNDDQFIAAHPVKISRPEVERLIAECVALSDSDEALRVAFDALTREHHEKTWPIHASPDSTDSTLRNVAMS